MPESRKSDLNPEQLAAVKTLRGPLLVLAGAGTGKTKVVTHRIAELIHTGTAPHRILAVTFTNRAADEMLARTSALLDKRQPTRPEISTFHSLCVRILRRQITRLGYPARFAICDRGDQEAVARAALKEIRAQEVALRPGDLLSMISRWKNRGVEPADASAEARDDKELLGAAGYRRYQNKLRLSGSLDFDDLLLFTARLFETDREARDAEAGRFDHVLIDEYQDTNGCQYRIVRNLAGGHRNLCVVGDDDQSIYGWRGAEVTHILKFHGDWPGAKVVRLERNYRSTSPILDAANRLIGQNSQRHDKKLCPMRPGGEAPRILEFADPEAEAAFVVGEIGKQIAENRAQPRDFAVLMRTNEQSQPFETRLRAGRVPYVLIGGTSFYERTEVKDVLAYLKLLVRPDDEPSLLRAINMPPRGIGDSTVKRLIAASLEQEISPWKVLGQWVQTGSGTSAARAGIAEFRRLIEHHARRIEQEPLTDVATDLIVEIRYQREVEGRFSDPRERQKRWAAVEELVEALARFEKETQRPTLSGFLSESALGGRERSTDKTAPLEQNVVALMTLHAAKGLEFPQVYLVGAEEGILPHQNAGPDRAAIEEERRLCYVGLTRARTRLTVTRAMSRVKWGKPRPAHPSRFLFDIRGQPIPPDVLAVLENAAERAADRSLGTRRGAAPVKASAPAPKSAAMAEPRETASTRRTIQVVRKQPRG